MFVHVPYCESHQKYVNKNEIKATLDIIARKVGDGKTNILVLTPVSMTKLVKEQNNDVSLIILFMKSQYKDQQNELRFQMLKKSPEYKDIPVLTIDQCQGKEADYVILSLVRKPTTFLNKNRLNVALSRVRKKLYFLNDKCHFLEASKNICWESHLLAKSLMLTQEFASQEQPVIKTQM
jgi:superfamily I DNA and/or RNA helicase